MKYTPAGLSPFSVKLPMVGDNPEDIQVYNYIIYIYIYLFIYICNLS